MSRFLLGATKIGEKCIELGLIPETTTNVEDAVYYLVRAGKIRTGRFGLHLLTTPEMLAEDAEESLLP
jgi:hypothetical protein